MQKWVFSLLLFSLASTTFARSIVCTADIDGSILTITANIEGTDISNVKAIETKKDEKPNFLREFVGPIKAVVIPSSVWLLYAVESEPIILRIPRCFDEANDGEEIPAIFVQNGDDEESIEIKGSCFMR